MHKTSGVGSYQFRFTVSLSTLLLFFATMLNLSLSTAGKTRSLLSRPLFSSIRLSMTSRSDRPGHLAVHVRGKLTPGSATTFFEHTLRNAKNSVLEKGISRFDVMFSKDDFLLIEVYSSKEGPDDHKKTEHYNAWREAVAPFMAIPREAKKYRTLFPAPEGWSTALLAGAVEEKTFLTQNYLDVVRAVDAPTDSFHPSMLAVLVDIQVVPGAEEAFIKASLKNCKQSLFEPGIHRFDLIQNLDDKCNFVLVEVYSDASAPAAHKVTKHYVEWAETVKSLMARPRSASKYRTLFPSPLYWHSSSLHTHLGEGASGTRGHIGGPGLSTVAGGCFSLLVPKITVGRGIANKEILSSMKTMGIQRPMLVTGKGGLNRHADLLKSLGSGAIASYCVSGEPTVEDAESAVDIAKRNGCDGVLSIGGGSAIDLAKVVAALTTNLNTVHSSSQATPTTVYTYMEVVGEGKAIEKKPLPHIAVPTTSGTGAEATKNAVLKSVKHGRKASIRHDWMLPNIAIIDPMLTTTCPPDVTAHVGLDALCQCIEPLVSNAANPIVDAIARDGVLRASRSLRLAVTEGSQNLIAREDMSIASLLGGLSLANAKLGAVHGYASVLGGMFETAPHGAICAALLPFVFRKNVEILESQLSANPSDALVAARLERFKEVAIIVTGLRDATAQQGALFLETLVKDLKVPGLEELLLGIGNTGFSKAQIDEIVDGTLVASSTKGNPVTLSRDDLECILKLAS